MLLFSTDQNIETNNECIRTLSKEFDFIYGLQWIHRNSDIQLDNKIIGCKFHGAYLGTPISKEYWRTLEYLAREEAILMVHCGRYKEGAEESNTSYLHALEVAKMYGGIKVIMAHMGGTDTNVCKKAIIDSRDYDNVYFDTSGITTPYIIEYAVKQIPSTRIMFGSDAPWCSFRAMYYTTMDASIPEQDKENIMYNSFEQLIEEKIKYANTVSSR